jgi:hypothetical protein
MVGSFGFRLDSATGHRSTLIGNLPPPLTTRQMVYISGHRHTQDKLVVLPPHRSVLEAGVVRNPQIVS